MEVEEPNFLTERSRCHQVAVGLASGLLFRAYVAQFRLAIQLGVEEYGRNWLCQTTDPRDPEFEEEVLQRFLSTVRKQNGS